jgi:tRNA (cytidine32/uridine32-2'-O)-methyltransferase
MRCCCSYHNDLQIYRGTARRALNLFTVPMIYSMLINNPQLENIRIILVAPTHPGNIGAVARAMKTMGFVQLYLVNPKIFPHVDATARAAGADDILAEAVIVDSLDSALKDCTLVVGTSARIRELPLTILDPRSAAQNIVVEAKNARNEIALVFGRESSGLNNEELQRCNYHICIPTNPEFSSLNLAAAVQLLAYEIRMAALNSDDKTFSIAYEEYDTYATHEEVALFYEHLEQVLSEVAFLQEQRPKRLMGRLQRLFNRARLERMELNILRGFLTAIQRRCQVLTKDINGGKHC